MGVLPTLAAIAASVVSSRGPTLTRAGPAQRECTISTAASPHPWNNAAGSAVCPGASTQEPWWVYAYTSMFDSIRQQRWDVVTGEVRELTGRAPTALHRLLG